MNNFPTLSYSPDYIDYNEEKSSEAVIVGEAASGYPVLNKVFTFDPKTFRFVLNLIPQVDKEAIITFYDANKDIPFYWLNGQDGVTYEVVFIGRPECTLIGRKDLWRVGLELMQSAPVV